MKVVTILNAKESIPIQQNSADKEKNDNSQIVENSNGNNQNTTRRGKVEIDNKCIRKTQG